MLCEAKYTDRFYLLIIRFDSLQFDKHSIRIREAEWRLSPVAVVNVVCVQSCRKNESIFENMSCIIRINDGVVRINPVESNEIEYIKLTNPYNLCADNELIVTVNNKNPSLLNYLIFSEKKLLNAASRTRIAYSNTLRKRRNSSELDWIKNKLLCNWINRREKPVTNRILINCEGVSPNLTDLDVCSKRSSPIHFNYAPETHPR